MGDKPYTCRVKKWGVCVYLVSDSLTAYVICFGRAWSRFKPWGPIELCGLAGAARLLKLFLFSVTFFYGYGYKCTVKRGREGTRQRMILPRVQSPFGNTSTYVGEVGDCLQTIWGLKDRLL